jgi:hypothetical protein
MSAHGDSGERGNSTTHASLLKNQFVPRQVMGASAIKPRQENHPTKQKFSSISVSKLSNLMSASFQPTPPQDSQSQGATWLGLGA